MQSFLIYINMKKIVFIILIMITLLSVWIVFAYEEKTVTTSAKAGSKYKILVDVEESKMYVFENDVCTKTYTCAGGKYSTPSPIGTWTITNKAKWGEGFGGSWLRI